MYVQFYNNSFYIRVDLKRWKNAFLDISTSKTMYTRTIYIVIIQSIYNR